MTTSRRVDVLLGGRYSALEAMPMAKDGIPVPNLKKVDSYGEQTDLCS